MRAGGGRGPEFDSERNALRGCNLGEHVYFAPQLIDALRAVRMQTQSQMEGQIRKQRQKEIYERQELIRKIWEWIGIIVLCITVIGFITLLAYLYVNKN